MINSRFKSTYALEQQPEFRVGLVTDFNTASYTADVKLGTMEFLTSVPIMGLYGTSYGTDTVWLQDLRGATVVLILLNNQYYILSTLPQMVRSTLNEGNSAATVPTEEAKGLEDVRKQGAYRNFNPNRPTDMLSGDKILRAEGGAEVSVLKGGVARLKASAMAQFILGRFKDFGRLITRRFQMFSDFGEVDFFHTDDGKVGLNIKGGASYVDETHPSKGKWTILLSMGHCESDANHRLYIETKDVAGESQVVCALSVDGKVSVTSKGDIEINSDKNCTLKVKGNANIKASGSVNVTGSSINLN